MKRICVFILVIQFATLLNGQSPVIIDHTCTNLHSVPIGYVDQARSTLHIAYGHTSHGSQLVSGMTGVSNEYGSAFAFNEGGTGGALDLDNYFVDGDLGNPDRTTWASRTREYLSNAANADVNVVIWSWCGQAATATQDQIETYLELMNGLENDYPNVKFVYMTGHLDGSGTSGNLNLRNEQIRTYCKNNNKILFDFADIESYDPDGLVNYMLLKANDNCDYDSDNNGSRDANWATAWCNAHPDSCFYTGSCAHSQSFNCQQKGKAAWWLWARLAGWNGGTAEIPVTGITVTGAGGATSITSPGGTLQLTATVLPANAGNKNVTWSITSGSDFAFINSSGLVTAIANGSATATATAADGSGVKGNLNLTISGQTVLVTGITVTGAGGATTITSPGGTLQLTATVLPANAGNKNVTWSITSGSDFARINSSGLVTAIAHGTVTATAAANDGSGIKGNLTITISSVSIPIASISVYGTNHATSISANKGTLQLNATITPHNATNKRVTWSVESITGQATINENGLLSAVANGTVIAKATANDGSGVKGELILSLENQIMTSINNSNKDQDYQLIFCNDKLRIRFYSEDKFHQVKIFDIMGKLHCTDEIVDDAIILDIACLPEGLYIIQFIDLSGKKSEAVKFSK